MKKRTDYSKEKKRTEPSGVRFDRKFLERIKKDTGLKSAQSIVDYLVKFYEQQVYPIAGNPVMERNSKPFPGGNYTSVPPLFPIGKNPKQEPAAKDKPVAQDRNLGDDPEPEDRTSPEYKAWRKRNIGF